MSASQPQLYFYKNKVMQKIFGLLAGLFMFSGAFSQIRLADYIRLDIRYYVEEGERYLGVSPELISGGNDSLSRAIWRYPRRFRYLIQNYTRFIDRYEKYYPDTLLINRLYIDSISADTEFNQHFRQLAAAFTGEKIIPVFTVGQVLHVAARFFYCEYVRPDSSLASSICIGRNGLKELTSATDLTLVEAICFEAIFERFYSSPGIRNLFINNFLQTVKVAESKFRHKPDYLEQARQFCFEQMQNDAMLKKELLDYYSTNLPSMPFRILFKK